MTQKRIFDLPIGASQYTEQSERGAVGRWYSMDKVRFRKGLPEKIGGWVSIGSEFIGICRRLKDWSSLDRKKWMAVATDSKLYIQEGDNRYDITPLRDSGELGDTPITTFSGEARVRVTHVNHGCQDGDYITLFGATAGGASGVTIDGEYRVTTYNNTTDPDWYEITHTSTVTTGSSGEGGSNVTYEYQITAGARTAVAATGYGSAPYGRESYGNARTGSTLVLGIRTWALDTWGEDLLACPSGGKLYWWDRSKGTGTRAQALGNDAPTQNESMIVSQRDRHLIALGAYDYFNDAFDPMLIRWCSTEDLNDWVPTSTNTAGDLRLYSGSRIVTGVRSRLETIVWTDVSVHTLPFVGGFDVFGLNIVGENVSILGPNAAVPIDHRVLFMAEADFYIYDGIVKVINCDVRNFVYDYLNTDQRDKVYGALNREFNEVWWFYPAYDNDAWVQAPFDLKLPQGYSVASKSSAEGDIGYTYSFNSTGYTEVTSTADNNYQHDYVLTNCEPILTPLEAEYAVELSLSEASTVVAGLSFLRIDLTGTINNVLDDAKQWVVELDEDNDTIQILRALATGGLAAPANLSGGTNVLDFAALTGASVAVDTRYIITVQVDNPQITVWVSTASGDKVQAFQFDMDAAELAAAAGESCMGLHVRANAVGSDWQFFNLAAGPVGVLSASSFDISPTEVNRYVMFNYEEGTWATGKMSRTAWADRSPLFEKAYATGPTANGENSILYLHETGTDNNGAAMPSFIESFDMEIPDAGEELMHVDQLIPDFLTLEGSVDVELTGRKYPHADRITKGPYTVDATTRKVSTRIRARQVAIKVSSNDTGDRWRMGKWRGRAGAHGKRG